jgi:chromosome segregation ATPase
VAVAAERLQLQRQLSQLEGRIRELEAEVAGAGARLRELESQLQARGR